jgi:hypothetical protein
MKPVADEKPAAFEDVLAAEYQALRPEGGFESGAEQDLIARMHRDPQPLAALCISGGGIRSATFALGVIQGLAERGLLPRFDYLSTVSGGGYIGGWLTAWSHRVGGIGSVASRLCRDAPAPPAGGLNPLHYLREYNSYMSPRTGLFSNDVWTLVAIFVRNILLNWTVLIPLLMAVLMVPRLYLATLSFPERLYPQILATSQPDWANPALDAVSGAVWPLLPALSALLLATALFFTLRYLPSVGGVDHSRYQFSLQVLAPLVGAVLTFLAFDSLYYLGRNYEIESKLLVVVGWTLAPCAAAWLLYLVVRRGSLRDRFRMFVGPLSLAVVAMAAGTGVAVWVVTNFLLWDASNPTKSMTWAGYVTVGPPLVILGFVLGTVLFVGLSSQYLKDQDREWMARAMGAILLFCAIWTGVCAVVLLLPRWALGWRAWGHGALAAATAASAWLSTLGGPAPEGSAQTKSTKAQLLGVASMLAAPVFLALLAGALSVLTNMILVAVGAAMPTVPPALGFSGPVGVNGEAISWMDHDAVLTRSPLGLLALVLLALVATSMLMARFVNINTFSLHGMYRDRLVRAYLGASNLGRRASKFTGFAANDDIPLADLGNGHGPFHVLNFALNLVGGNRLDWQQRKAEAFTATPFHCGSRSVGYRPSSEYGGGITLGTAIAISGAAASPNMGYHSSSAVGAIMTLFNARQGCWLGNPGPVGALTWRHPSPLRAVRLIVNEALGQTSDESEYVYLSDGGHFENLAMYEMVRRRCRTVVVLDGGCDPEFRYDDLADALRKIRIDMGISIDFEEEQMQPLRARQRRCAVGIIRYSAVDGPGTDGRLIYVKAMLVGNEGPDVLSYAAANPTFPHQTTSNQWFNESQTESYRSLGLKTVDDMCRGWQGGTLDELREHLAATTLG